MSSSRMRRCVAAEATPARYLSMLRISRRHFLNSAAGAAALTAAPLARATAAGVAEGSVGAGTGATVGKLFVRRGMAGMKGGVGSASARLADVVVSALVVVNASGDIVDWRSGTIVAGARTADGRGFARTV